MIPGGVVYVVDDDASMRRALARTISATGVHIETFRSAKEFLAHPPPDGPACLVLDLSMPGDSGLDLQAALREARRWIPIIFLTGHATVETTVRAMKSGAFDFLQKPVDVHALLDGISRALTRSRDARAAEAARSDVQRRCDTLTYREREVLDLVVTGMLNKEIGAKLGMAERTVKSHRARVMEKMVAGSVAELVRMLARLAPDVPES